MKTFKEIYLQKAWGVSKDNISLDDVKKAIKEIQKKDEEQGYFWVGIVVKEDENILEAHNDMSLIALFEEDPDEQKIFQAKSWEEVENLFNLFLEGEFDKLKSIILK